MLEADEGFVQTRFDSPVLISDPSWPAVGPSWTGAPGSAASRPAPGFGQGEPQSGRISTGMVIIELSIFCVNLTISCFGYSDRWVEIIIYVCCS